MGREYIAHGLYYRLLSYVFPRQPFWYYFTNYLLHVCVIGLSTRIVWQATRSWAAAVLCTLTGGFASTGPEVFLTLFKDELQTTLWLLVALLLVQGLMRPERSRYTGALVALGRDISIGHAWKRKLRYPADRAGRKSHLCGTHYSAAQIAGPLRCRSPHYVHRHRCLLVERYLVGTSSIGDGGYTGSLFVSHPTLAASLDRARLYEFHAGMSWLW
jgi:hypothetical protein